jgi:hypothetical protein
MKSGSVRCKYKKGRHIKTEGRTNKNVRSIDDTRSISERLTAGRPASSFYCCFSSLLTDSLSRIPPRTIPNTVGGVPTSTPRVWLVPFLGPPRTRIPRHLLRKNEPSSRLTPECSQRSPVMRSAPGVWSGGQAPYQNLSADGKVRGLVTVRVHADQFAVVTDFRPS